MPPPKQIRRVSFVRTRATKVAVYATTTTTTAYETREQKRRRAWQWAWHTLRLWLLTWVAQHPQHQASQLPPLPPQVQYTHSASTPRASAMRKPVVSAMRKPVVSVLTRPLPLPPSHRLHPQHRIPTSVSSSPPAPRHDTLASAAVLLAVSPMVLGRLLQVRV
jgi:hypothetical protein